MHCKRLGAGLCHAADQPSLQELKGLQARCWRGSLQRQSLAESGAGSLLAITPTTSYSRLSLAKSPGSSHLLDPVLWPQPPPCPSAPAPHILIDITKS